MHTARRIAALLLLALWLPAVMHCRLEAVGVAFGMECCADTHDSAAPDDCAGDACALLESGDYSSASASLKVTPSATLLCAFLVCAPPAASETTPAPARPAEAERARDWVPAWQFVRRAAAPAHAPDSLFA